MASICRKEQLQQRQAPLCKRLKELLMELAQQTQLLIVSEVPLQARPTALEQKQKAGRPLRAKWVGGNLGLQTTNATQKVACRLLCHSLPFAGLYL